jgi:hypothetical protein
MRKFRFAPMVLAVAVYANAQAHPVSLNSACGEHHHFFPAHLVVLKPDILQEPYQNFLATHVSTSCSAGDKSNLAPASCGGVTHAAFARHTAQETCEKQSQAVGVTLKYNLEMIKTNATSAQPLQTTSSYFPYTLRIACGVCSSSDVPPT